MGKRERARKSSAERTRMRRRSKQNKSSMVCITVLLLAMAGIMSVQMASLYEKNQAYRGREQELQSQLEAEQARQEELEEYGEYITTKEYIEKVAKTKLGLVYPNEVIFKEKGEAP